MQRHLKFFTNLYVKENLNFTKIRGVSCLWKIESLTAIVSFYFDGEPNEEELEEASITCTEIIANVAEGFININYFRLDCPNRLPKSSY